MTLAAEGPLRQAQEQVGDGVTYLKRQIPQMLVWIKEDTNYVSSRKVLGPLTHQGAAGMDALHRTGSLAIYLSVSFRPNGGLPATKVVRLVLRR